MCQKKSPSGMVRLGREAFKMSSSLYSRAKVPAIETTASRRNFRDILRLLGCSRQDVAFKALKAAVFSWALPACSDHPAHEVLHGTESRNDSAVPAG